MRCRFECRLVSARCESSRDTGPPSRSGLSRPASLRFGVASRLTASRTSPIPWRAATSRQTPSSTPPFSFSVAPCGRPSSIGGQRSTVSWQPSSLVPHRSADQPMRRPGPLKCRPSHTAQFPVRRCSPLRSSARARPSRIVCPWLLFRPSRVVWLRFLSVFDRSSRRPSRPAAGAGREGEKPAGSWARAPHRAAAISAAEKQSRRVGAPGPQRGRRRRARRHHVRAVAPRRSRLPRGARARYARQPSP